MIRIAAAVGDRWRGTLTDDLRLDDSLQAEIARLRKQVGLYEDGIFNDMNIAAEVAGMIVHQRHAVGSGDPINGFDTAASMLALHDRARYFAAKARACSELVLDAVAADSRRAFAGKVLGDCRRSVLSGYDPRKAIAVMRRSFDTPEFGDSFMVSAACLLYRSEAAYFVERVRTLRAAHRDMDAFNAAVRAMKELPPTLDLGSPDCAEEDSDRLAGYYDGAFISPIVRVLATAGGKFLVETCNRHWEEKRLVARLLPRVTVVSADAFVLFRRAGEDDDLKNARTIAMAELSLWKRAGRVREFKKQFPERYAMAVAASGKGMKK